MKKTMSLLLAFTLAFALTIPVFASSNTVNVAGETISPTIQVTMPVGVVIGLNPYGMTYSGHAPFFKSMEDSDKTAQILSLPAVIENRSDSKISVCAEATTAVTSSGTPSTDTDKVQIDATDLSGSNNKYAATEKAKKIQLTMQLGEVNDDGTWKDTAPDAAVFNIKTGEAVDSAAKVYYGIDKKFTDATNDDLPITADGDGTTATLADKTKGLMKAVEIAAPTDGVNYIGFKFGGVVNDHPQTAWGSGDTLIATLVFDFKPMSNIVPAQNNGG